MLYCRLLRDCKTCGTGANTPFSCCSPYSLVQTNILSFPKTKSECNSWYMVKSSFHASTLTTLTRCQFGFTWHDPFLSSLFPAVCPTVTRGGTVYSKCNVQEVPCYCCLLRFVIQTLKWNAHKALYCKGTTRRGTVLLPGVLVRKHLLQTCLLCSFGVSWGKQHLFFLL